MIYTVTLNPSIDYILDVQTLTPGATNRSVSERFLPGGKGLNVSMVLNNLGVCNVALGFLAGFTGTQILQSFSATGGSSDFIRLKEGVSRINVKIRSADETEINASGPCINKDALNQLFGKLSRLQDGDILVLAGSIPATLPDSLYCDIIKMLSGRNISVAVDATGKLLLNTLPYQPFLIKPNHHELGALFGVTISSKKEAVFYAGQLREQGAKNVLVSMGGQGAVLVTETGGALTCQAPSLPVKNSVGAGDSMVAGFLAGWCAAKDYAHALKMGVAAGSASAFSDALATKPEIEQLYRLLKL